jgi:hypothetical protein
MLRAGFRWASLLAALSLMPAAAAPDQSPPGTAQAQVITPTTVAAPAPAADEHHGNTTQKGEASQLDTFWLRDRKGNLVPVLGMTFEEFEQLLRLKQGLAAGTPPDFSLDVLALAGSMDSQIADFQVTTTIRARREGWIRVPLLMSGAVLRQPPQHQGKGEFFLGYDAASGGHVLWLNGPVEESHTVTFRMSIAVTNTDDDWRLALSLPRATESSLRLRTRQANVEAELTAGDGIVATRAANSDSSEITVLGAGGGLQLIWHKVLQATQKGAPQLDANGEILVRIESEHRITSDAHLRVRSYGGPIESFRVRLPPRMELVPSSATGYSVTLISGSGSPSGEAAAGQIVEVRLDKPSATAEVRLLATLQPDEGPASRITPARFEVIDALRQRGTIDFAVEGEWRLEWKEDSSARRLDLTPEAIASRWIARFDYFRQPCNLELKVTARPSRVTVEPAHLVHVDRQQLRLESTFKFRFRGPRAEKLVLEPGDWKVDRLSPDELFDSPLIKSGPDGQMIVPFRSGVALPTELELKLEAHRLDSDSSDRISFTLPRAIADVVAPATVIIAPADNVELLPQAEELIGLSPEAGGVRIPFRQQAPLVFRDVGGGEPARFVAMRRIRARSTTASGHAVVRLDRQQMQIEQRLEYHIAHEPQRAFKLAAPRDLNPPGGFQVWLNNEPTSATLAESDSQNTALQQLEFATPTDQIGLFQVAVRCSIPLPRWDGQKPLSFAIPLVLPLDEGNYQFTGQQIEFQLGEALQIEPDLADVEEIAQPNVVGAAGSHFFAWSQPRAASRWLLQTATSAEASTTTIDKAWIQTWLSPQLQQERVALRLTTRQDALRVRLPTGITLSSVQAAIDGQATSVRVRDPGMARIETPPSLRGRAFTLELWYSLDSAQRFLGVVHSAMRPAQIEGAAAPRRIYWQLALPEDEYLVIPPGDMSAEMVWSVQQTMLARRPLLDQLQLEAWMEASRQDPLPRGTNAYLYGALGRIGALDVVTVHRRVLVAIGSGGALLLGLALLHISWLRRPQFLIALAVLLAGLALAAPDLGVLVAQWSVAGMIIALGAVVWVWLGSHRATWTVPPPVVPTTPSRESSIRRMSADRVPLGSQLTTAPEPASATTEIPR